MAQEKPIVHDQIYTIIDAARIFGKIEKAQELENNNLNLFNKPGTEMLSSVAPYLFPILLNSDFGKWLLESGWGNSWGVYINCKLTLEELNNHFQKFIIVNTEDGKDFYFRFYDPRVLRIFLPTCDEKQLQDFFGSVNYYAMEDENSEFALKFSLENSKLKIEKIKNNVFWDVINGRLKFEELNNLQNVNIQIERETNVSGGWSFTKNK